MIFDTNARPRPEPVGFVVTNGSKRWGRISSGTPGPLSFTQNSSGSDTRVLVPGSESRTPGRKAVAGLVPISAGHVMLGEHDITRLPAHQMVHQGLAFVPQTENIFATLTIA